MVNTTSAWYSQKKDSAATFFSRIMQWGMLDGKNYEKFFEPGNPSIWEDSTDPSDITGRAGIFL
jgi:hypothetical protein